MMNDDESNIPEPGDETAQESAATSEGQEQDSAVHTHSSAMSLPDDAEAMLMFRQSVTHQGARVDCFPRFAPEVFAPNPMNPKGEHVPDMRNQAVFMAKWFADNWTAINRMALDAYNKEHAWRTLHQQTLKRIERHESLRLVDPGGKPLSH